MKTKLLYLASFMLVLFTACSVEESSDELSEQEKDFKVKSLVKIFAEDVRTSPDYIKFVDNIQKTKSSGSLSQEELDQLEQEFLSQQSPEFVELYYFVASLNLSNDELRSIIFDLFEITEFSKQNKNDGDDCAIVGPNETSTLWIFISTILCELDRSSAD